MTHKKQAVDSNGREQFQSDALQFAAVTADYSSGSINDRCFRTTFLPLRRTKIDFLRKILIIDACHELMRRWVPPPFPDNSNTHFFIANSVDRDRPS